MTLDEQIAILQAAKEGKKVRRIPFKEGRDSHIINKDHPFDFSTGDYEIVREPILIWREVMDE